MNMKTVKKKNTIKNKTARCPVGVERLWLGLWAKRFKHSQIFINVNLLLMTKKLTKKKKKKIYSRNSNAEFDTLRFYNYHIVSP